MFTIGSPDSKVEWVYVDNLAHGHLLAAQKLSSPSSIVTGQAYACNCSSTSDESHSYFVSDQAPINNFEFFRPLYESLGYSLPRMRIPLTVAVRLPVLTSPPPLTSPVCSSV